MPQVKIKKLHEEHENLEQEVLKILYEEGSQKDAAKRLGIAPSTLGLYLKQQGYIQKSVWVKQELEAS